MSLLAACDEVPGDPTTRVLGVQVVAVVAEPPELLPGQPVALDVAVGNPSGRRVDVAVWPCTVVDGACAEASLELPLSTWTRVVRDAGAAVSVSLPVPDLLDTALADGTTTLTAVLWTLSCERDLCPIVDLLAANPPPGTVAWDRAIDAMSRPDRWLSELPLDRASLAVRRLVISERPIPQRNLNPVLSFGGPEPVRVRRGEEVTLRFTALDAVRARPFTTLGRFSLDAVNVIEGSFAVSWLAPDAPGEATLWVSVDDGVGGYAVWSGAGVVE